MLLCEGMSRCWVGGGMVYPTIALLLIALGVGAMVKFKAISAPSCQTGGKVLGYFIMIVAAIGLVCSAVCAYKAKRCHGMKSHHDVEEMPQSGMQLPPGHPDISKMPAPKK